MPTKHGKGTGVAARKKGKRYVLLDKGTGKTVGHSTTKAKAKSAARVHNALAHGWKPSGKRRQSR